MPKADVGDRVLMKRATYAGKEGTVKEIVRRRLRCHRWNRRLRTYMPATRTALTYIVDVDGVGIRRPGSSEFDVIKRVQ